MDGQDARTSDWARRLKVELQRDKKKTIILLVLLLLGGILGGRMLMTDTLPDKARADDPLLARPVEEDSQRAWRPAPPGPAAQARREKYLAQMDRNITRDLFRPNLEFYPAQHGGTDARLAVVSKRRASGWFGHSFQWGNDGQDARRDQTARIALVRARAQALSLQSTMLGPSPSALINGQVLREGEWISGFRVKEIASDSCVVSQKGVDVLLRMKD